MSGGYGISTTDIEASRLVFVSVKDAKPRRKSAVPVPDGATWESFCSQIQHKLKLRSIGGVYLASSGEQVTRTEDLKDIDELHVVEAQPLAAVSTPAAVRQSYATDGLLSSTAAAQSVPQHIQGERQRGGLTDSSQSASPQQQQQQQQQQQDADIDNKDKYARRQGSLQRSLARIFPSLFQPVLPVTIRDTRENNGGISTLSGRKRRRRGRFLSLRIVLTVLLLLTCLGTLLFLYSRLGDQIP